MTSSLNPTMTSDECELTGSATESAPQTIALQFGAMTPPTVRKRMMYAFQVFAAIYNYRVLDGDSGQATIRCNYGVLENTTTTAKTFLIPARYQFRKRCESIASPLKHRFGAEDFVLFYGLDEVSRHPDWLGEIFEWLTASHELAAGERDSVGRIPFAATVFNTKHISPRKPYASVLMAWMQHYLTGGAEHETLPSAPSPLAGVDHIVVSSHDIDFYWTNVGSALARLTKNLGIAFRLYNSPAYFAANIRMMLRVLGGNRVGDYLPALLEAGDKYGFRSTLFAVARKGHRRDPNYHIENLRERLRDAAERGFEVALHGSYRSAIEDGTLESEARTLEQVTGQRAIGGRQHWLRFDNHQKLFEAVKRVGFTFDSTLGFAEAAGFRNGASFAFPPYDFDKEEAFDFLEFPLVLMDGNLEATARNCGETPSSIADEILNASRRWGWGGIAVLWHNPVEALSVPEEINDVFWGCVKEQDRHREKWMSADDFLSGCLARYHNAGLLRDIRRDA
jgi:peptidoglycan/xylan/chitin deacetylase (PgdA/CDA1 family)